MDITVKDIQFKQYGSLLARYLRPQWVRVAVLGVLLHLVVFPRRHIVRRNLEVCFPDLSSAQRRRLERDVFIRFAQAWLDRSWIWHGDPDLTRRRLRLTGALDEFAGEAPTVIFAPHFVGMDAGWTAITQQAAGSSLAGKCLGWMLMGMPRKSRHRGSSINRYAWRCGERFGSGRPPLAGKIVPKSTGQIFRLAPCFAVIASMRSAPRCVQGEFSEA